MWPKKPIYWTEGRTLKVSVPFTWELQGVLSNLQQPSFFWDNAIVGGPAVELMPGFFDSLDYVAEGHNELGVLQRVNPLATRTTTGCVRRCEFCAIGTGQIEGAFKELKEWPDLPIISDNNLLAASKGHFDKVIDRLKEYGWADFNQGLDSRLLTDYHAKRLVELKHKDTRIRLALDHLDYKDQWQEAYDRLRDAGMPKKNLSSYCIVAFTTDPKESWQRCEWVESHGVMALPQWFHALDQLEKNIVTDKQKKLGWTDESRKEIMGYYYRHRGSVPEFVVAI